MTIEEKLKDYILERYNSLLEFTQVVNMSYSTVTSMLKRGIDNSSVSNVIKVCNVLGLSVDELANGKIVPVKTYTSDPGLTDVSDILADVKSQLTQCEGLTLDGKPADKKTINTIVQAIDIGEEMAKRK